MTGISEVAPTPLAGAPAPLALREAPTAARGAVAPGGERFAALLSGHLGTGAGGEAAAWETVTLGEMIARLGGAAAPAASRAGAGLAPGPADAGAQATLAGVSGSPAATPAARGLGDAALLDGAGDRGEAAVAAASRYLGVPYRWGGDDPAAGLDCSGLVQQAFADLGVALPRVSADQSRVGHGVPSMAEARPGDLVFWRGHGGRPNHIGVYAGNGQMIHAPRRGDVVRLDSVRAAPPDAIRRVR